ncbi:hypothetical protein SAMN04488058_103219 [Deinococcus reticulitermitis]|uniref:Outer membrane protein beta-barrel domain-containing protein n=1 Tax=Deinococcus reticulitermitis TaxID=856736 RepID=A0A1H6VZS6_9DEIO|nr:hypothetical protein [Deinococcus reticulitermitis]SEJ05702.1 hypothetical protein SAMN04488058_103219 [Deinococcus reticulitermitis]
MRPHHAGPFLISLAALGTLGGAQAATVWAGGDVGTGGYGVHAGASLLRVPVLGTLGVEGSAERGWRGANRYAAGLTLRDLNLPLTRVDAFATVGAEYRTGLNLYAEGGLRGPLLGPAGWRAYVRGSSGAGLGAGLGVELRF